MKCTSMHKGFLIVGGNKGINSGLFAVDLVTLGNIPRVYHSMFLTA